MKRIAKDLFRSFGYELITTETARAQLQAGSLRELIKRFRIELTLDIGANRGQFHQFMRSQVGFAGTVVSFEPIPSLAEALRLKAMQEHNWLIRPVALGATPGTAQLNVAGVSEVSSFLTLGENAAHIPIVSVETVTVETLNEIGPSLFERIPPERTFMKLDTQGYDLEVLRGATTYLQSIPVLSVEVPFIHIYEGMRDFSEYFAFLQEQKFDVVGMWPTYRDELFRAYEFDCLFVNREQAEKLRTANHP